MKVKEILKLMKEMNPNAEVQMPDGLEVVSVTYHPDKKVCYISDEKTDVEPVEQQYTHILFKSTIDVRELNEDERVNLVEVLKKAGQHIWRASDKHDSLDTENDRYPFLIFDETDWCLSIEWIDEDTQNYFDDFDGFIKKVNDYIEWKKPYMIVLDANGANGHCEELELEVVAYDRLTTNDVGDTEILEFQTMEQLELFEKYIVDVRPNKEKMYAKLSETVAETTVEDISPKENKKIAIRFLKAGIIYMDAPVEGTATEDVLRLAEKELSERSDQELLNSMVDFVDDGNGYLIDADNIEVECIEDSQCVPLFETKAWLEYMNKPSPEEVTVEYKERKEGDERL